MGGGAGIEFKLTMDCGSCNYSRGKIVKVDWKVEKFDAHGYMDGWSDINGKYLKVKSVTFRLHKEDFDWAKKDYSIENGQYISISAIERNRPHFCIFSGYVRGDYRNCFPATVTAYPYLEYFGEVRAEIEVEPARGFQGMYKDVFDDWCYHGSRWTGRKWEK
jgi:hypothetical protein